PQAKAGQNRGLNEETPSSGTSNVAMDVLTNFLPPETEAVCNVRMEDLFRTPLGRAAFETPGSFRADALQKRLGFSIEEAQIIIQAWNFTKDWSFNVIHTSKPFSADTVKAALRAKPAAEKIEDQDYFILDANPWLAAVGKLGFVTALQLDPAKVTARKKPLALRIQDEQTLIVADEDILKEFLNKKGAFPRKQPKPKVAKEVPAARRSQSQEGASDPEFRAGRGRRQEAKAGGVGRRPGTSATPTDNADESRQSGEALTGTYLTIDQRLKEMLDRLDNKQPVAFVAVDTSAAGKAGVVPLSNRGSLASSVLPS